MLKRAILLTACNGGHFDGVLPGYPVGYPQNLWVTHGGDASPVRCRRRDSHVARYRSSGRSMSSAKKRATPTGSNPVKNAGHGARPRRRAPNDEISPAQRHSTPTPHVGFGLLSTHAAAASRPIHASGMAPGGGGVTSTAAGLASCRLAVFRDSGVLADITILQKTMCARPPGGSGTRKPQHSKRGGPSLTTSRRAGPGPRPPGRRDSGRAALESFPREVLQFRNVRPRMDRSRRKAQPNVMPSRGVLRFPEYCI